VAQGIRLVPLADAVADTLRMVDREAAFSLVAWLVTRESLTADALASAVCSRRGRRGMIQARQCLELVEAGAASYLELETHNFLREARITGWKANVPIRRDGRVVLVADILFDAVGLIVEVDGYAFHGDSAAFERDRARDAVAAGMGFQTLRITHHDLSHGRSQRRERLTDILTILRANRGGRPGVSPGPLP
jgi:very-short-patch-repair endonuclease